MKVYDLGVLPPRHDCQPRPASPVAHSIVGGWVSELRDMLYSTHRWAQQTAPKGCSLLSNPQHIRAIHDLEPEYIADMITEYTPGRQLRFSGSRLLRVPRHNLERYGRRGYSVMAPRLWNDLPDSLRLIYSHELIALHPLIRIRIMSHPDMG